MTKINSTSVNPAAPRLCWLLIGCALVQALVALNFIFVPLKFSLLHEDKFYHAIAHALPACWFFMLYRHTFERRALLLAFLLLAALNELLQPLSSYHTFDVWDIAANLAGVGIAWLLVNCRNEGKFGGNGHFFARSFKA